MGSGLFVVHVSGSGCRAPLHLVRRVLQKVALWLLPGNSQVRGREPAGLSRRIGQNHEVEENICPVQVHICQKEISSVCLRIHICQCKVSLSISEIQLVKKKSLSSAEENPICLKKCLDKGNRSSTRKEDSALTD